MSDLIDLVQAGAVGIAIILVIALVTIIRSFLDFMKNEAKHHQKSYDKFEKAINKNTKMVNENMKLSKEMYKYQKLRNGILRKENNKK